DRGGLDPQAVRRPRAARDDGGLVVPAPVHLHQVRDRHRRGHRRARLGAGAVGAVHARGPGARHAAGREHADRLSRLRLARGRPRLQARARRDAQVAGRIGPGMGPSDPARSAGGTPRRRAVVAAVRQPRAAHRSGHATRRWAAVRRYRHRESLMQLVCPAGNLPALQAAIDAGADAVYAGFRDQTNARAFPGLNFDEQELRRGIAYAHARGRLVYLALNTYPDSVRLPYWQAAVDHAAELGVDAIIAAEMGVLDYACRAHPALARHLSVQGSATTAPALKYAYERFGIARAVLPRVLALQQVQRLCAASPVPLEVFAFGSLCIMVEGRCQLSSYVTGVSPNR